MHQIAEQIVAEPAASSQNDVAPRNIEPDRDVPGSQRVETEVPTVSPAKPQESIGGSRGHTASVLQRTVEQIVDLSAEECRGQASVQQRTGEETVDAPTEELNNAPLNITLPQRDQL